MNRLEDTEPPSVVPFLAFATLVSWRTNSLIKEDRSRLQGTRVPGSALFPGSSGASSPGASPPRSHAVRATARQDAETTRAGAGQVRPRRSRRDHSLSRGRLFVVAAAITHSRGIHAGRPGKIGASRSRPVQFGTAVPRYGRFGLILEHLGIGHGRPRELWVLAGEDGGSVGTADGGSDPRRIPTRSITGA